MAKALHYQTHAVVVAASATGWSALIIEGADPDLPPVETSGSAVVAEQRCEVLAHRIEFPDLDVTLRFRGRVST
ncbi:MAG TPA: hypothetical protein VGJ13_06035 [Pseudonocardiaceae bacterium]|jgi:hypothetical protein